MAKPLDSLDLNLKVQIYRRIKFDLFMDLSKYKIYCFDQANYGSNFQNAVVASRLNFNTFKF